MKELLCTILTGANHNVKLTFVFTIVFNHVCRTVVGVNDCLLKRTEMLNLLCVALSVVFLTLFNGVVICRCLSLYKSIPQLGHVHV